MAGPDDSPRFTALHLPSLAYQLGGNTCIQEPVYRPESPWNPLMFPLDCSFNNMPSSGPRTNRGIRSTQQTFDDMSSLAVEYSPSEPLLRLDLPIVGRRFVEAAV